MTGQEAREEIATAIASVLGTDWTTYAGPPDVITLPAAVVVPRQPYGRPGTFCAEILQVQIQLLLPRASGLDGINLLDGLVIDVRNALIEREGLVYQSRSIGQVTITGGVECNAGMIDVELYL